MKSQVLEAIGEVDLRRAVELNAALAANDRVKFYFALLQVALDHAAHPGQTPPSLKRERIACGIQDSALDGAVSGARRLGQHTLVPGAARIMKEIAQDMRVMAAPVSREANGAVTDRLKTLLAHMPKADDDLLARDAVTAMVRPGRKGADSLHQLVMDLHKRLNTMQADLAEETLDGAAIYALGAGDRPLVSAFMAGLNRTAPLKFDHPGLGTTATRAGDRLVIQNDIGTTDAHVLVIHVEGSTVSVTYSDVHPERLRFFQALLAAHNVTWDTTTSSQQTGLAEGMPFHLATGRVSLADTAACAAYLDHLGSRLVFLIDWNRARKQLRTFLGGPARIGLLRWAAEHDVGHRGFLELGGAELVNRAIEQVAGSAVHFGDRLCDILGEEEASEFLRFVLRAASEGLRGGQSRSLIRDRIRAELQRHFTNDRKRFLRLAAEHAGLVFELGSLARDGLEAAASHQDLHKLARRARRHEHDADQILINVREAVRRRPDNAVFQRLLEIADDAADELEDVVFVMGLLNREKDEDEPRKHLAALAALAQDATQEWVKALARAANVQDGGQQQDADDFLIAIDAIAVLEHKADDMERDLAAAAIRHAADFRQLHVYSAIGRSLEATTDALKRASLVLREHVLGTVLGG